MHPDPTPSLTDGRPLTLEDYRKKVAALEARLEESEQTLDAIARGDFDAVVTRDTSSVHRVYTLNNADHPYRVLIEQIQEGAVTLGLDGTVFYCNRRLAEMLGLPQERVIGQKLQPHFRQADLPSFERLLRSAYLGHARMEVTVRTATGMDLPVYFSLSLLDGTAENPLLCGVLADLTEQKLHLRELSDANARLLAASAEREVIEDTLRQSQKMEAVGQLTGGLAHDFNNLLAIIMGNLELMDTDLRASELSAFPAYIKAATASAHRAAAVTHRLLSFSRRQALNPKLVLPNSLVIGIEALLRQTLGAMMTVQLTLEADVGTIFCDANQLENALLNLAINARDAMPDGGQLTITTMNDHLDEASATPMELKPGRYVRLAVTDTGVGMSPKSIALAFDPFFTTKPLGQGTGLGLSMVYGFAKQSGGHARISSTIGLGTTVSLYMPLQDRPKETTANLPASTSKPATTKAGETVLIVDDEADLRAILARGLRRRGYDVLEAGDGKSGLQVLEDALAIDLLVTDVGLPGGMNGRQLADAARVARPKLKVLFVTGYADHAVTGGELAARDTEVMTKPFVIEDLALKIRAMINDGRHPVGEARIGSALTSP